MVLYFIYLFISGPLPYTCTFDIDTCGIVQQTSPFDQFDWTRRSGSTDTLNTGPTGGQGGSSFYFYIETSSPRMEGDRAL